MGAKKGINIVKRNVWHAELEGIIDFRITTFISIYVCVCLSFVGVFTLTGGSFNYIFTFSIFVVVIFFPAAFFSILALA